MAVLLAVWLLALTACGSGEPYVEEMTTEDGTKITEQRDGGKKGPVTYGKYEFPDGSVSEEFYDEDGNLAKTVFVGADGMKIEDEYYPSGNLSKNIFYDTNGTYSEVHYLDDGSIDEASGTMYPGTLIYNKFVDAEGNVEETRYELSDRPVEEDGSKWMVKIEDNGVRCEICFRPDQSIKKEIMTDPETGEQRETEYYANMCVKKSIATIAEKNEYREYECYENGQMKHTLTVIGDERRVEDTFDEEGYCTYFYYEDQQGIIECISDDTGKLVKVIEDGKEYTSGNKLKQMRQNLNFRS